MLRAPHPACVLASLVVVWLAALLLWFLVVDVDRHETGWLLDEYGGECAHLFWSTDAEGFVTLDRALACDDREVLYQREESS